MKENVNITMEIIQNKISEIVQNKIMPNEDGGIEMYLDYRDELSKNDLYKIMKEDNPREIFNEIMIETEDNMRFYYEDDIIKNIKDGLSEEEIEFCKENEDELKDWFWDKYFFYIDTKHFNTRVNVNIMLDVGNCNYDFTRDNILNYYNYYSDNGKDLKDSSVLWLARQQKKVGLLREAIKQTLNGKEYKGDKFIESCIYELENLSCHMGTLTFLVNMDLFDYFNLREAMEAEKELNNSYIYEDRKGTGSITISKDTRCGLFNHWDGGGSDLDIELDKDVVLPIKCIWQAEIETGKSQYGYSVDSVYGLVGSAWDGEVKGTHYMNEEEIKEVA